ncbi:MAG: hypothetical protein JW755_09050 [Candidatus Aminicenantes bacterium]|nr:hypothetical protein [Candidatus Aminicenantes bacterium]
MLCSLYRWYLSRSLDLGKSMPAYLIRHGLRCQACREFSDFCTMLKPKAADDFKNLLEESSLSSPHSISLQADNKPVNHRKRLFTVPSFSAAAVVLFIIAGLIWLTFFPLKEKDFPDINLSTLSLEKVAMNFEDPYEKEYLELKRTMKSTANYLAACLDIQIGDSIE